LQIAEITAGTRVIGMTFRPGKKSDSVVVAKRDLWKVPSPLVLGQTGALNYSS
jgi:hypothetical protein